MRSIAADPAGKSAYEANATAYLGKLDALDQEVKAAVAAIPADRRRIITSHDAFGYFQQAYGVDFIAPQGVSTEAEPSARDVARIITQVKKQKIPAVFLENITDARLMERIAKETGARIGGKLYFRRADRRQGRRPELRRHDAAQRQAVRGRVDELSRIFILFFFFFFFFFFFARLLLRFFLSRSLALFFLVCYVVVSHSYFVIVF